MSLTGKRALVLGGSGGIGRELSLRLARAGCRLLVHGGYSKEALSTCLKTIEGEGGEAEGILLPLSAPQEVDPLFKKEDPFDIVVSAFGPFLRAPLSQMDAADWERMVLLNLALPGYLVSRTLAGMEARGYGVYLFFGGTNGDLLRGYRSTVAYAAAKAGLSTLVKSIALSSAPRGVRANLISPGLVETEYCDTEEIRYMEGLSGNIPLLKAADVADLAYSLIENSLLNGSIIAADAGLSVGNTLSV